MEPESNVTSNAGRWMEEPRWKHKFRPFTDQLDFLSLERQHLNTGRLMIFPSRGERKRFFREESKE